MNVSVSGLTPAVSGDDWFLLDKSGSFALDKTVMAVIWLVGGGCDGDKGGRINDNACYGGKGGDGGCVYRFGKIKLDKNTEFEVHIAGANERGETSFKKGQIIYRADGFGAKMALGGDSGIATASHALFQPVNGLDGVLTPYGYVGSSGGGGACSFTSRNPYLATDIGSGGLGAGNGAPVIFTNGSIMFTDETIIAINAQNYGCGGGGQAYCSDEDALFPLEPQGKRGCVIVQYKIIDDGESAPECSIQYWNNEKIADEAEKSKELDRLNKELDIAKSKNIRLRKQLDELKGTSVNETE